MKTAAQIAGDFLLIEQGKAAIAGSVESVWGSLAEFAGAILNPDAEPATESERVAAYLESTVEVEIVKQQNGKKSKPGAYRSAKSVLCKAVSLSVPLFDASGKPRGKTAVEKDCKTPKTPEEKVVTNLKHAIDAIKAGVPVNSDIRALIVELDGLL